MDDNRKVMIIGAGDTGLAAMVTAKLGRSVEFVSPEDIEKAMSNFDYSEIMKLTCPAPILADREFKAPKTRAERRSEERRKWQT